MLLKINILKSSSPFILTAIVCPNLDIITGPSNGYWFVDSVSGDGRVSAETGFQLGFVVAGFFSLLLLSTVYEQYIKSVHYKWKNGFFLSDFHAQLELSAAQHHRTPVTHFPDKLFVGRPPFFTAFSFDLRGSQKEKKTVLLHQLDSAIYMCWYLTQKI